MGGACGDLITAMIDPQGTSFHGSLRKMNISSDRQRLKKPYNFANDLEKDIYLDEMSEIYASVPSHDIEYHVRRGHKFIGIRVQEFDVALWAAERFKNVHRAPVWESIKQGCNIDNVEQYAQLLIDYSNMISNHTNDLLDLESIVSGRIVPDLERIIGRELSNDAVYCYQSWQDLQNGNLII
jgi:hypothetical protein